VKLLLLNYIRLFVYSIRLFYYIRLFYSIRLLYKKKLDGCLLRAGHPVKSQEK